jgi:hypothetical protein
MTHWSSSQLHCASHAYSVWQEASSAATCALQLRRRQSLHAALFKLAPMLPSGNAASGGFLHEGGVDVATAGAPLLPQAESSIRASARTRLA